MRIQCVGLQPLARSTAAIAGLCRIERRRHAAGLGLSWRRYCFPVRVRELAASSPVGGAPLVWLAAATATIVVATSPPSLGLDLLVAAHLQAWSPTTLHRIAAALDMGARGVIAAVVCGAVASEPRCTRDVGPLGLCVLCGAFAGELLKTAVERLRPSSLPDLTTGNSLPSGHVMNTALAAVAAWQLAAALPRGWRHGARTAVVLAVAAQSIARVLHGSHWPSDLAPSILLAIGWMAAAERWWSTPRRGLSIAVAGAVAYAFFLYVPSARLVLPSAINRPRTVVAFWDPARDVASAAGPLAEAPASWSVTLRSPAAIPDDLEIVAAASCDETRGPCRTLRLSANGGRSVDLALRCGPHWYSVDAPALALKRGTNRVTLQAPPGCLPSALALHSARLVVERPALASSSASGPGADGHARTYAHAVLPRSAEAVDDATSAAAEPGAAAAPCVRPAVPHRTPAPLRRVAFAAPGERAGVTRGQVRSRLVVPPAH